ncbi:unnamed protein product [Rotaria sp. Silwood1]|nr:unnamed protein product [Rotaria sp. Silwood1]
MSLDISTHKCLSCCTSNITTDDCCQCPLIWDGFCLHPLVSPPTSSSWWYKSPIDQIRDKFSKLDGSHQTIVLIILILILILWSICFIMFIIRQFNILCFSSKSTINQHVNVEYVVLENLDDDQITIETTAKLLVNAFVKKNNDTELSLNGIHREELVTQTTTFLAQA